MNKISRKWWAASTILFYVVLVLLIDIFIFHNWPLKIGLFNITGFIVGLITVIIMLVRFRLLHKTISSYIRILNLTVLLFTGIVTIFLSYDKALWVNPPWDPGAFGAGISLTGIAITLMTVFWPRNNEHKDVNLAKSVAATEGTISERKIKSLDLCVPIYLNQQIIFDLLAIVEDGFSNLSNIKISSLEIEGQKSNTNASIGISNAFALLDVSLKSHKENKKGTSEQMEIEKQKVHTPTSLFAKLRVILDKMNLLHNIQSVEIIESLKSGEFVEFRAILRKNPLVDALESLKKVGEMATSLTSMGNKLPQNTKTVLQQIDSMIQALTVSNSVEIIADLIDVGCKAVLTTKLEYFKDRDITQIIDGEFSVLGKVIRVVKPSSSDKIDLLRNTKFGLINRKIIDDFSKSFKSPLLSEIKIPEPITEISGPALQIVPIAIFT